jgi:tetratricopeptide (TPR) repeat protein
MPKRRSFLAFVAAVLLNLLAGFNGFAQPGTSNRADEWNSYKLPSTEFVRQVDDAGVIFRRPAAWQPDSDARKNDKATSYHFTGPYSAHLTISIEKIPDGLPLPEYAAAILQQLRNLPEIGESLTVRSTEMAGLEAREIMFAVPDDNAEPSRRLIWCTVSGPVAVAVILIAPESRSAELEPYLRGVVDTLTITEAGRLKIFEILRAAAIKESKPARVDEVQSLFTTVNGLDAAARNTAISKLTSIVATKPELAIDYLLDRRPILRAATLQAVAGSQNHVLDPLLMNGLRDKEDYVAQRAAAGIAALPNALSLLREETLNWMSTGELARVWHFLPRKSQVQILSEVFSSSGNPLSRPAASRTTVRIIGTDAPDPNAQLGLLTLLVDVPVQDFKVPFAEVLKANNDLVTAAALQVAATRAEHLPVADLIKLLSATHSEVRRLAALNLGDSATTANISELEDLVKKLETLPATGSDKTPSADSGNAKTVADLRVAIRKIRLRDQLATANAEQKQKLLREALADKDLAQWTWLRYVRDEKRSAIPAVAGEFPRLSPFGENAFPEKMTHYVAIENPADTFHKLSESLNNIQLDSARAQANLVLVLNGTQKLLAASLSTPSGGSITDYSGIKATSPAVFGSWIETGAPAGTALGQRKAVIVRVRDRDRFEHSLALYQDTIGEFASLPDGMAVLARFLGATPAILPLSAETLLQQKPTDQKDRPILSFGFQGVTMIDGLPIRWFSKRHVSKEGIISNDVAYLYYVGDTAVMTPDIASLREVLSRVATGGPSLSNNPLFQTSRKTDGEAIYFSDLTELLGQSDLKPDTKINETGALKISNNSWESSYHLSFSDKNWSRPLLSFQPAQLSAPRDLLPRSTLLYYFMNVDAAELQRLWNEVADGPEKKSLEAIWAGDFEKDVVPEIDAECGAAMLGLPDLNTDAWKTPWVIFLKLKSDKLKDALAEGRLFKNAEFDKGVAKLKYGSTILYVTIKSSFLVISDSATTLALLNQPDKLVASPDFAKAVKRTPSSVAAFGGYNLEETALRSRAGVDSVMMRQADLILSLVRAFHSPSLYATVDSGNLDARSSISMDREGRYSVAELQSLTTNSQPRFAIVEPTGLPITDQNRVKSLKLRIHAKAAGEVDRIVEDLSSNSQNAEKKSEKELQLEVFPRRADPKTPGELPINSPDAAPFLAPAGDNGSDDKSVADKAREIAGNDRDAWSVARKLTDWTYKNLTWKLVDQADAAQTLASREADCYEFSKLYVAMARSLGLPARIVSGLAYSGGAFGGHAWVEVYAGNWIEIDPTWGTNFVDATHIRDTNGALMTYAALNLIQLEVIEAPRGTAEFQATPNALIKQINEELPAGRVEALQAVLDVSVVLDELMGPGAWAAMSESEKTKISGVHRQTINGISSWLKKDSDYSGGLRLLKLNLAADHAEALFMLEKNFEDVLVKFRLVRRGQAWFLTEILQADNGLKFVSESFQPALQRIQAQRKNDSVSGIPFQTNLVRVLATMRTNPQAAVELADRFLKVNAQDRNLRFVKSLALSRADKNAEAISLWTELSETPEPVAAAMFNLAEHYAGEKEEAEKKKAIDWYLRYVALEPDDPRARTGLAAVYENVGDFAHAETEYRAAVERDSLNSLVYLNLAEFYAARKRYEEAAVVIDDAAKQTGDESDLFADLISRFWFDDTVDIAEGLANSQPRRMTTSARANLVLGSIRVDYGRVREALPLLKKAAKLDPKTSDPHAAMARAYRKLHLWTLALNAADSALRLNKEDADAHYQRACALARLGRKPAALAALKRAIELDEEYQEDLKDEEDLKPLAASPEFKKLLTPASQP